MLDASQNYLFNFLLKVKKETFYFFVFIDLICIYSQNKLIRKNILRQKNYIMLINDDLCEVYGDSRLKLFLQNSLSDNYEMLEKICRNIRHNILFTFFLKRYFLSKQMLCFAAILFTNYIHFYAHIIFKKSDF